MRFTRRKHDDSYVEHHHDGHPDQHGRTGGDHARTDHHVAGRREVVAHEREEHGGVKWGSALFGWLVAMGAAVLLTALATALGAALRLGTVSGAEEAEAQVRQDAETVGLVGAVVLLVVLLLAYYAGGYVAGRMARFDGARQGIAVWAWAVLVAVVVAVLGVVAGTEYDVLSRLGGFPRIPVDEGDLTVGGIVTAVLAVVVALVGAILGGLAGMRFHRRVDRTGLGR